MLAFGVIEQFSCPHAQFIDVEPETQRIEGKYLICGKINVLNFSEPGI